MNFQLDTVIIATVVAVVAPSILAIGNARIATNKQKLQWTRDDALENRHIAREKVIASKAKEAADINTERLKAIEDTANIIHSLVNTDLTEAYQRDLSSVIDSRDALQRVIDITLSHGSETLQQDKDELALKDLRIAELERIVKTRLAHQEVIDTQSAEIEAEANK